ncbi:MAG: sel1 repeat family protein [Archangiaceae bacterium]|nr:sel1 repeat family protein [Archangiaceae bacterium]
MRGWLAAVLLFAACTRCEGDGPGGNLEDARKLEARLSKACEARDAAACDGLGDLYAQPGNALTGPLRKTREKACGLGSGAGCRKLGALLADGDYPHRVNVDPSGATAAFAAGCQAKDAASCTAWGERLAAGRGANPDDTAANEAFRRGCELNDSAACQRVGR